MPRRTTDFRGLAEPSRVTLLALVQQNPGSTARELADRVGLHLNTTRDHLDTMEREGMIASRPVATGTRGRPPLVYSAVDDPAVNAVARRRIERAREHRDVLRKLTGAERGRWPDVAELQIDTLYQHLDDTGLQPEVQGEVVKLRPCPSLGVADGDRALICGVHERLVGDTLAQVPGPLKLKALRPFVGPNECHLLLETETDARHVPPVNEEEVAD